MKLENMVAIVTGSSRGIGRAIALAFAREGADLVVNDLDLEGAEKVASEVEALGRRALAVKADVSRSDEVSHLVKSALAEFEKIDVLVNNAGILLAAPLEEISEEYWDRVLDVNLKGTFLCSQAVGREMIKRRKGSIINIGSIAGCMSYSMAGSYGPSKAAVINLTKQLAMEWAKYNIRVNAINPGLIRTPFTEPIYTDEEVLRKRIQMIPLGRIGTPEDVAEVAVFLASEDSSYVTGQTIMVDGGLAESMFLRIPRGRGHRPPP